MPELSSKRLVQKFESAERANAPLARSIFVEAPDDGDGNTEIQSTSLDVSFRDVSIVGLFVLAVFYTLYFAKTLVLPIVLAVLLNFLLSPVVRSLARYRIPRILTAAVLIVSLLSVAFFTVYKLSQPASQFIAAIPDRLPVVEHKLRSVIEPMRDVAETAKDVEEVTGSTTTETEATPVVMRGPGLLESSYGYIQSIGAGGFITVILLMFLLSMDQVFLHKLVRVLPTFKDKRMVVEIFREIEIDISRYLLTVTLINTALGTAVAMTLYFMGVPNAIMWGVMAGMFNYIPYLGPGITLVMLLLVGVMTFDEVVWMAAPAFAYACLNMVEAYCLTPLTLGNRLNLNPVAIFLSLAFWSFLWSVPGMLLAVPILVTVKLLCDHVERLSPLSEFLAAESS